MAAPACAWVAGLGLFKTLFIMAIMHRYVQGGTFDGPIGALSNNAIFYPIIVLAAIEIVIDLIPRWDIQWDRWTGHLRLVGAVVLSFLLLSSQDIFSQITMAIVGAALAITSFTAKTSARKAAIRGNTSSIVAPVSSVTETCLVAATLFPLSKLPPMSLLMLAFMIMAALLVIYVVRKESRETLAWIFGGPWKPAQ